MKGKQKYCKLKKERQIPILKNEWDYTINLIWLAQGEGRASETANRAHSSLSWSQGSSGRSLTKVAVTRELLGDQRETCPCLSEQKSTSQQTASLAVTSRNIKAADARSTFPATNDLSKRRLRQSGRTTGGRCPAPCYTASGVWHPLEL